MILYKKCYKYAQTNFILAPASNVRPGFRLNVSEVLNVNVMCEDYTLLFSLLIRCSFITNSVDSELAYKIFFLTIEII